MNRHILLTCLLILVVGLSAVYAQHEELPVMEYSSQGEYEIGGVTVIGTENFDKNVLISLSGLRPGDKIAIPGDEISKAIKNLWKQKLFTNISIAAVKYIGSTVFLEIQVQEMPRLARYTIKGVKNNDVEDLRKKLDLRTGRILSNDLQMSARNIIERYYIEKGFLDVSVDLTVNEDSILSNSVFLEIAIERGRKIKVNNITFHGNDALANKKLRKEMRGTRERVKLEFFEALKVKKYRRKKNKVKLYNVLADLAPSHVVDYMADHVNLNFFKASKFQQKDYENDKAAIIMAYNNIGYRDARIWYDTIYRASNEHALEIDIHIDEGNQYFFRNIEFVGNTIYADSTLSNILGIQSGEIYNQGKLEANLMMNPEGGDVTSLYMDNGYLFFSANPVEKLVEGDSIDLEIRIYEGPQATIDRVVIRGNTKTNEHVIRRELRVRPGDIFSRQNLIRSQREIINLGYFDPESMEVNPVPNPEKGTVDIEFRVAEKPSDQLELSAGWGGRGRGVVGTLGVSFTNFSLKGLFDKSEWNPIPTGDGQTLSVRVQSNGRVYQSYNFSFTEPWLGGKKPNSLTFSFFRTRFNDLNAERRIEGKFVSTQFSLGMGIRLKWPDDFFTFQPSISYERYDLNNWSDINFLFNDGQSNNINFRLTLARNSLNNPLFPTGGSSIQASVKFTLPYSLMFGGRRSLDYTDPNLSPEERWKWIEYHKWTFKADWYQTLVGKLVLRATAKMGFLGTYNQQLGLTPFERFELGGDGISNFTLVGREQISLRGYSIITPSSGAPIYNKYSLELRYPFSTNPSATVFGLLFFEGGNFYNRIADYNPFDLRRSYGAGIRVFLPMFGLLGFDYGIGFDDFPDAGNNVFGRYGEFRIILGFEPE